MDSIKYFYTFIPSQDRIANYICSFRLKARAFLRMQILISLLSFHYLLASTGRRNFYRNSLGFMRSKSRLSSKFLESISEVLLVVYEVTHYLYFAFVIYKSDSLKVLLNLTVIATSFLKRTLHFISNTTFTKSILQLEL